VCPKPTQSVEGAVEGTLRSAEAVVQLCKAVDRHAGGDESGVRCLLDPLLGESPRSGLQVQRIPASEIARTIVIQSRRRSIPLPRAGSTFLAAIGVWTNPPAWSGFVIGGIGAGGRLVVDDLTGAPWPRVLLTVEVFAACAPATASQ
jgi:hypothetical protein